MTNTINSRLRQTRRSCSVRATPHYLDVTIHDEVAFVQPTIKRYYLICP
jgi:hypothetical protein